MRKVTLVVAGALGLASASCGWSSNPSIEEHNSDPGIVPINPDEVAVVRLNFTTVPDPVKCISVTAVSGGQTKTKNVDVTPGTKPAGGNSDGSFDLGRFPPGPATFSGKGYEVACASVTSSTVPSWFSAPQVIKIVPGPEISLVLNLQRVHSPDVTVNFELTPAGLFGTSSATLALLEDGTVKIWGVEASDVFSNAKLIAAPATSSGLSNVGQLAGANRHNCALLKDGTVRCWGFGSSGSLGDGDASTHFKAAPGNLVSGLTGAVDIASHHALTEVGGAHTCVVLGTGEIKCWGSNSDGAIGQPASVPFSATPVSLNVGSTALSFAQVCVGANFACGLDNKNFVSCWGRNDVGQLGRGHADPVAAGDITRIVAAGAVTSLACGGNGACLVRGDGSLWCWGQIYGDPVVTPTKVEASGVQQVAVGTIANNFNFACLRRTNQQVACWGRNVEGELGDGTGQSRDTPDVVTIAAGATDLAVGNTHACAIVEGRTLCWGDAGFIGDGARISRPVPTAVKW